MIHWGSYEAFPDGDHIFQQAFAAEDPAPLLLDILKEHPTYFTLLLDLFFHFVEAMHNDPYRGQILASALAKITHSPDAPSFGQDTLHDLLYRELADSLFNDDYDSDIAKVYGPKNPFLLDSLISGFSFKYKLTESLDMYGFLNEGLKAPRSSKDLKVEVSLAVVGTCIQLLLSGSRIRRELGNLAKILKVHEAAGTVKDRHAIEVLKVHFFAYYVK